MKSFLTIRTHHKCGFARAGRSLGEPCQVEVWSDKQDYEQKQPPELKFTTEKTPTLADLRELVIWLQEGEFGPDCDIPATLKMLGF